MEVKVAHDSETVERIIDLRYAVLRKPWNKARETATDELEPTSVNVYIEQQDLIVACGRLQNNGNGIGQIRYMAVLSNFQGKGLGRHVLLKLEEEARKMCLVKIELQARENAVNFYKLQDYKVVEKSFKLWDIVQHYLMTKSIK